MLTKRTQRLFGTEVAGPTTTIKRAAGGYGIWEYSEGTWSLRSAVCPDGYTPGAPPDQPGRFEGELIRKYCEPIALVAAVGAVDADRCDPQD
jgi:hypothetical protein